MAAWVDSEKRAPQPPLPSPQLRAQRFRRAKGPLPGAFDRPRRPLTAAPPAKNASPNSPLTPARPHTAPMVTPPRSHRVAAAPSSGFRKFTPREAPPMPAMTLEEHERMGLVKTQECAVCLRQHKLADLPGVTSRRAGKFTYILSLLLALFLTDCLWLQSQGCAMAGRRS